ERPIFQTDGQSTTVMRRPVIGTFSLAPERTYYWVCLGALALAIAAVARIRRSGLGRVMLAVRDNELAASAMGLSPTRVKLFAFAVSGALAGLAGGLLVGLIQQFTTDRFDATASLQVVAVAVVGGLSSITGAVLGALLIVGLPAFFPNSAEVTLLTSGIGVLVLLLYFPGGLVQILYAARDAALAFYAKHQPASGERAPKPTTLPSKLPTRPTVPAGVAVALRTDDVSVRFGMRTVVDNVSLEVRTGEVVGLIGTNG